MAVTRQRQIFQAESQTRHLGDVLRAMVSGMVQSPYMAYRLCMKDIRAEYVKSAFGILWDFMDPLVLGCVFYVLRGAGAINTGDMDMPYTVFVVYGLLLFQTFSESITLSLDIMRRAKGLVDFLKLPPEALILSVFFRILFNSYSRILVMLAFSLALYPGTIESGGHAFSSIGFVKFLLCYPSIILLGMSIGLFLAPFGAVYADVGRFVRVILVPLRYMSQTVLLVRRTGGALGWLYTLNPVVLTLENLRFLATSNTILNLDGMILRWVFSCVVFVLGWLVFHVSMAILSERA
jgi:lipopolysaccharide transport system permease protein